MTPPSEGRDAHDASGTPPPAGTECARGVTSSFSWAVASRPKTGQGTSGDAFRVHALDDGSALVVVVDGIGHGPAARAAADCVLDAFFDDAALDASLRGAGSALAQRLAHAHEAGRRTRGSVLSAALVSASAIAWIGVGNVEAVVRKPGARERLLTLGGIVGERLPNVLVRDVSFERGDAIVLATDGAPGAVLDESVRFDDVERVARELLGRHATGADDALVFVGVRDG